MGWYIFLVIIQLTKNDEGRLFLTTKMKAALKSPRLVDPPLLRPDLQGEPATTTRRHGGLRVSGVEGCVARRAVRACCCGSATALQAAYDGTVSGAGGGRAGDVIVLVAAATECCSMEGWDGRASSVDGHSDDGAGGDRTAEWQHANARCGGAAWRAACCRRGGLMSGGYGCALVRGGRRHGGPVRCGGCDGSCCKLLWWPVRQRLCCFDGDGGLTEARIESRRVVAMLRT